MENYKCEICGETFGKWQQKANHVRWNHKTEEFLNSFKEKQTLIVNKTYDNRLGKLDEFKVKCFKCGKEIIVKEREKQFPKKEKYYCSRNCANSHIWTEENKLKQSITIKASSKVKEAYEQRYGGESTNIDKYCPNCNQTFSIIKSKEKQIFCSRKCKNEFSFNKKSLRQKYKSLTIFKFSLNQFSEEFDFHLIKQHGWYQAKNHGDNLNGVSRDHMLSIDEGMKLNINPLLLSHPANCQLLCHSDNSSKHSKSSITLEQLLEKIKNWDLKYGNYYKEKLDTIIDLEKL